jgi:hypothetical protein
VVGGGGRFAVLPLCHHPPSRPTRSYLRFVAGRATGEVVTGATWQRAFIASHPAFVALHAPGARPAGVSHAAVPPATIHDLLAALLAMAEGRASAAGLTGASAPPPLSVTEAVLRAHAAASGAVGETGGLVGATAVSGGVGGRPIAPGVRMRGRSFAEEVREVAAQHAAIRALVERYAVRDGRRFDEVPAFLGEED